MVAHTYIPSNLSSSERQEMILAERIIIIIIEYHVLKAPVVGCAYVGLPNILNFGLVMGGLLLPHHECDLS